MKPVLAKDVGILGVFFEDTSPSVSWQKVNIISHDTVYKHSTKSHSGPIV